MALLGAIAATVIRGVHAMTAVPATAAANRHVGSIAIIGVLFFIIGFFTWINGPLITFVKLAFDLDEVKAFFVVFVFYISYFVLALPASWALKRTGLKKGLALSLFVMAVGAAVFGELSTQRIYRGRIDRPLHHRRWPGLVADRGQSLHQHPGADRKRGPAHRPDGHLQQGRRHAGAVADRRIGAARHRRSCDTGGSGGCRHQGRCC